MTLAASLLEHVPQKALLHITEVRIELDVTSVLSAKSIRKLPSRGNPQTPDRLAPESNYLLERKDAYQDEHDRYAFG